ncbi:MAG: hypothetical protein NTV00_11005 [Methylococcales bacterium]|nr:hypothetical protein [Methylococcales bacterium]
MRTLNETAYYHVGQRCFLSGHEPLDWLAANVEQTNPSMVRFFESIDLLSNTKLLGRIDEN